MHPARGPDQTMAPSNRWRHHVPNYTNMIVYDFVPQFLSIVHNTKLMQPDNVNIDPTKQFAMYVPPDGLLGEVHTASVYRKMYQQHIVGHTNRLLAPLICMLIKYIL